MTSREPSAVGSLRAAYRQVLSSRDWAEQGGSAERVELLVKAACHARGGCPSMYLPSYDTIARRQETTLRHARIRAAFAGGN